MKTTGAIISILYVLALSTAASVGKLHVPGEYATIQAAIDAAYDGDTVIVADGVYTGEGNRDIDFLGKAITVQSESGPENCIVDCNGSGDEPHRGFYFANLEGPDSILDGFSIINGYAAGDWPRRCGGAVFCAGSSPTIKNCNLTQNRGHGGGAVYCQDSSTTISNCSISDNTGGMDWGGGISCYESSPDISNCTISDNSADGAGGIYCDDSSATIVNCTISCNQGGGILFWSPYSPSKLTVADCIIANNMGSGVALFGGSHTVNRCIISANTSNWGPHWGGGGIYGEDANLTVDESVIADNSAPSGGGIYLDSGQNKLVMRNCIISGNIAEGKYPNGGGIYCAGPRKWGQYSVFTIRNCSFSDNKAKSGGAIYSWAADLIITDCNISGNSADRSGGGISCPGWACLGQSTEVIIIRNSKISHNTADIGGGITFGHIGAGTVENTTISGNSAFGDLGRGGGASCYYGTRFSNCTITGNSANYGGGIYYVWLGSTISNCILWDNDATYGSQIYWEDSYEPFIDYTDLLGGWEGLGNIAAEPCFVEAGYWDVNGVWVDGDYRLWEDSPCIDGGDPNYVAGPNETDLDGNPRVINGRVDMGAYEYWPAVEAEMKLTPQSLNCAGRGKYIKAHITLAEGFLAEDVDVNEPALAEPVDVESEYIKIPGNGDSPVKVEIGFDRQEFCDCVAETGQMEVTVSGYLTTGQLFIATDTLKIGNRGGRR